MHKYTQLKDVQSKKLCKGNDATLLSRCDEPAREGVRKIDNFVVVVVVAINYISYRQL